MECAMWFEELERRRLCSVTVNETFPGYYEVVGDESDDVIVVSVSQNDSSFTLNDKTYTDVSYISVYGQGGNDTIDVSGSSAGAIGASIDGGDGNDAISLNFDGGIWAGAGNDVLHLSNSFRGEAHGEGGDDQIFVSGDCIDPEINGGDGNDFIDASGNNYGVVIRGGEGDDTIYGSEHDDQIYGDAGTDFLYGLSGDDRFYCQEGACDHVFGGDGTDVMYVTTAVNDNTGIEYILYV
jgi:Ca2+-binding RTX toxin-like protein